MHPVLLWVVICDVVSVVFRVMLFLSWFRTRSRRADLLSFVASVANAGLSLNLEMILFVMICICSIWKAAWLSTAIALSRSAASERLARSFASLVEMGVSVCMVCVLVVVD